MTRVKCIHEGCFRHAINPTWHCSLHGRICIVEECTRASRSALQKCVAHGGGSMCIVSGCGMLVRSNERCVKHGGGKRCTVEGCGKGARGNPPLCFAHSGKRGNSPCLEEGCPNRSKGASRRCFKHGGGYKCAVEGCTKSALGAMRLCALHKKRLSMV